jgi:trans-aconitate 2-methyltransferase
MSSWDPNAYERFEAERARPSRDLIARLADLKPRRILDLGCGSGLSTLELKRAFKRAEIVGVDLSADMLKAAAARLPGLKFLPGDAATFDTAGFDLVFANALFHWVPEHIAALARIARALPPGGALAAQMPDNDDEPSHRLMRAVAALPAFRGKAQPRRERIGGFAEYEAALCPPCNEIDLWRTTYAQRMPSAAAIVKWVEGAGLRPYLDPLDAEGRAAFLAAYEEAIAQAYPAQPSGVRLFPFPRLFLVAAKARG